VDTEDFLRGEGEMGALIRAFEWSRHPLGPPAAWPQALRAALSLCLNSRYPFLICWGPELVMLYNDAYRDIIAAKHPRALGQRVQECWFEIWDFVGPMLEGVLKEGRATWADDLMLPLRRKGYPEECYFTFSCSPILGEGGDVEGVFTAVTETTRRVVNERRLRTLRSLGSGMGSVDSTDEVFRVAVAILTMNPPDVPFALVYELDADERTARLVAGHGFRTGSSVGAPVVALHESCDGWPLAAARRGPIEVEDLPRIFGETVVGRCPEPVQSALILPIARVGQDRPDGLLVVGLNPRRPLDADYRSFLELAAGQIAAAVAHARGREEERRRAEKLAELDRAKSAFFSNMSHELRTPLTLILGITEKLRGREGAAEEERRALAVVERNARTLVRHVGDLLDAARFEAGELDMAAAPVDLGRLVRLVAGHFDVLAGERGMRYEVDAPEGLVARVDREKVERVVLNLLSNAFKFTPSAGAVRIAASREGGEAVLTVDDSGPGVPASDRERIFGRFWQGERGGSRRYGGTGLGLAICREFVEAHRGTIGVGDSQEGGARFEARLPLDADLPEEPAPPGDPSPGPLLGCDPAPGSRAALQVVEELRAPPDDEEPVPGHDRGGLVLVVEDHADMRRFLVETLGRDWRVAAAVDAREGLEKAIRLRPDLVLTDVMMPGPGGETLVRELRSRHDFDTTPILVVTARADDELRGELLEAGALDYLVKPFDVQELRARSKNLVSVKRAMDLLQIELAVRDRDLEALARELVRRQQESRSRERLFSQAQQAGQVGTWSWDIATNRVFVSEELCRIFGLPVSPGFVSREELLGQVHPDDRERVQRTREAATRLRRPFVSEHRIVRPPGETRRVFVRGDLVFGENGEPAALAGICHDVTEAKETEEALRDSERRFREAVDHYPDVFVIYDALGRFRFVNRRGRELSGLESHALLGRTDEEALPPAVTRRYLPLLRRAMETRAMQAGEITLDLPAGAFIVHVTFVPLLDGQGAVREVLGVTRDLTELRKAERESLEHLAAEREARSEAERALDRLKAVQRVTEAALADLAADDLLRELLKRVRRLLAADMATVLLLSDDRESLTVRLSDGMSEPNERKRRIPCGLGIAGTIAATRRPLIVEDLRKADVVSPFLKKKVRSLMGVPLIVEGDLLGVLHVATRRPRLFTSQELALLQTVAGQIALGLDRSRLFEEIRAGRSRLEALSRRLVDLQEAERQEIARELHDEVGALLTGLKVLLEHEARRLTPDRNGNRLDRRREMRRIVNELMARVRDLSMDLRPPMLDDLGLSPTLLWHIERFQTQTGVEVDFRPAGLRRRYAPEVETAVFRIVQEALTNVARHAKVRRARVEVAADRSGIRLVVQDAGCGFDAQAVLARPSSGLSGMRERARLLGGQLAIESSPGVGARLTARIPLLARARAARVAGR
jgi:PAS domain S-box-containing protein